MSKLHFAYGSNLWLEQMYKRCPDYKFVGKGKLKGYRWIISQRGYANIIKSENDEVQGVIFKISPKDEESLDFWEGVKNGFYNKEYLSVLLNGENQNCLVYIDPITQEGAPKPEYIKRINQGLSDAQLPEDYINKYIRKYIPE